MIPVFCDDSAEGCRGAEPNHFGDGSPFKDTKTVKIADFGLARVYEASQLSGLTLNEEVGGTYAFMPPEQITHYRDVKPTADQYSAAASFYHLLTGAQVFDLPRDSASRMVMILTQPHVPIRDRKPSLPEGLAAAIHKALAKDPKDRHATVTAFRDALIPFANWTEPKAE